MPEYDYLPPSSSLLVSFYIRNVVLYPSTFWYGEKDKAHGGRVSLRVNEERERLTSMFRTVVFTHNVGHARVHRTTLETTFSMWTRTWYAGFCLGTVCSFHINETNRTVGSSVLRSGLESLMWKNDQKKQWQADVVIYSSLPPSKSLTHFTLISQETTFNWVHFNMKLLKSTLVFAEWYVLAGKFAELSINVSLWRKRQQKLLVHLNRSAMERELVHLAHWFRGKVCFTNLTVWQDENMIFSELQHYKTTCSCLWVWIANLRNLLCSLATFRYIFYLVNTTFDSKMDAIVGALQVFSYIYWKSK